MQLARMNEEETARQDLRQAAAALDAAERQAQPMAMSQALAELARCYRRLQAPAAAEAYLDMALRWARAAQATDQVVDLLCELCETTITLAQAQDHTAQAAAQATRERARDHAFEASSQAAHVADAEWEVKVLLRVSDALNRLGDHDDASQLQTRALRLMSGNALVAANPALLPGLGRLADG
jgi:hypothetical protein